MGPRQREFSETTAQLIDKEIAKFIDEAHRRAKEILTEQQSMLEKLARILLEKESIEGPELKKFWDEVKERTVPKVQSALPADS